MAADLRRSLGADVELIEGRYGEFTILVDGEVVVNGGALAFLGVLPRTRRIRELVEQKIAAAGSAKANGEG